MNELGDELLALGDELHVPVLGSGHPLGDILLLKHSPTQSEIHEGVAFFGRAGPGAPEVAAAAVGRPSCCVRDELPQVRDGGAGQARAGSTRELHIVQPKLLVAMGDETVAFVNALWFPLSRDSTPSVRSAPEFTPTIQALVTPDIDASLDEQDAKTRFWNAFKALGTWWSELPPY